jgi:hypothetical protein
VRREKGPVGECGDGRIFQAGNTVAVWRKQAKPNARA